MTEPVLGRVVCRHCGTEQPTVTRESRILRRGTSKLLRETVIQAHAREPRGGWFGRVWQASWFTRPDPICEGSLRVIATAEAEARS